MPPRPTDASSTDEESRALYQARLSFYARILALLGFGFLVLVLVVEAATGGITLLYADIETRFRAIHIVLIAVFATLWLTTRREPWTRRSLEAADLGVNVIAYGMVAGMLMRPEMELVRTMALLLTELMIARAILVPSAASRTAALGAFATVLSVATTALVYARGGAWDVAWAPLVDALGWPIFSAVIATVASHTIYGLRAEVKQARRLGQYELEAKLGEGGMGVVYLAQHALLRRPTAVKLLPPDRVGADAIARFEREVRQTARLTHPNTVQIYDYGRTPEGVFYYAMEYLPGCDLDLVVSETGPMPPARVIHVVAQVAGALAEAHELGLVHRDVKPANVLITKRAGEDDVAKVVDFGLVKELARDASGSLTQDADIQGTPLYLAPETIAGERSGPAADLYALGAVAYYLLTGTHVFRGTNVVEICAHHLHSRPDSPSERLGAALPGDLEAIVLRCLAKRPEDRFESARAFRSALLSCAIEPWSEDDARRFWSEHGAALEAVRAERAKGRSSGGNAGRSLAIDLEART